MKVQSIEKTAETIYFVKPQIEKSLKDFKLSPEAQQDFPGCSTYFDIWTHGQSNLFFNMANLIRIAAGVETGLRDAYCLKKGYANTGGIRTDPDAKARGIFQRILPWNQRSGSSNAIDLFGTVGVDLTALPRFAAVQELMLHRHLYAHNCGVIDDDYIDHLKELTGTDLRASPQIVSAVAADSYPNRDKAWLEPLHRVGAFLEAARKFFHAMPP